MDVIGVTDEERNTRKILLKRAALLTNELPIAGSIGVKAAQAPAVW